MFLRGGIKMSKGKIAIFIPVRNEEEKLTELLSQIPQQIREHEVTLVVVDDCSNDESATIARSFTPHVVELRNMYGLRQNGEGWGVGLTTKTGFQYIGGLKEKFVFLVKLDGDGQHYPEFLSEIVRYLEEGNDIVICSRFHPLSDQTYTPFDRILLNKMFTERVREITGWNLTDARSGYMGFKSELIEQIANNIIVEGYGVPMEILLRIWDIKPDAQIVELAHPAAYGGYISNKLHKKYEEENIYDQSVRVQQAATALLKVLKDLGVSKEHILNNGWKRLQKVGI